MLRKEATFKRVHTVRMSPEQHAALKQRAHDAVESLNQYTLDVLFPPDAIELCIRGKITREECLKRIKLKSEELVGQFLKGELTWAGLRAGMEPEIHQVDARQDKGALTNAE